MIRFIAPLLVFIAFCSLLILGLITDTHTVKSALTHKSAPAFDAPRLLDKNQRITSDIFKGKISVLNVWASWCPTCYLEHPFLMELAKKKNITSYGLNYKDTSYAAKKTLQKLGNPYKSIIYDPDGAIGLTYGVTGTPETFIIDKKGIVRYKHTSEITKDIWKNKLLPLINELSK